MDWVAVFGSLIDRGQCDDERAVIAGFGHIGSGWDVGGFEVDFGADSARHEHVIEA